MNHANLTLQTKRTTYCIYFSDDSLRYEYPFTLKLVLRDGSWCSQCQWHRFCRGCALPCSGDDLFVDSPSSHLAIDWDQTALHLRLVLLS